MADRDTSKSSSPGDSASPLPVANQPADDTTNLPSQSEKNPSSMAGDASKSSSSGNPARSSHPVTDQPVSGTSDSITRTMEPIGSTVTIVPNAFRGQFASSARLSIGQADVRDSRPADTSSTDKKATTPSPAQNGTK
jgi:hypothetical protein